MSSYVEQEDTREVIDITELNAEIARIVSRQQELRTSTDKIVADVPGSFLRGRLRVPGRIRASLDHALERGLITMRGYDRCLRVAWTAADLAGRPVPAREDIAEALYMRRAAA